MHEVDPWRGLLNDCGGGVRVSTGPDTRNHAEGATYIARPARERLAAAQAALDSHPVSLRDGRCITCGTEGGCTEREEAALLFARYGVLPRRCPEAAAQHASPPH